MREITVTELKSLLDAGKAPKIIDVRQDWEYEADHIEAENIPLHILPVKIHDLGDLKDKEFIVCCRSGGRSGQACMLLHQAGFNGAINLRGGMMAWKAEIDPNFNVG